MECIWSDVEFGLSGSASATWFFSHLVIRNSILHDLSGAFDKGVDRVLFFRVDLSVERFENCGFAYCMRVFCYLMLALGD